MFHAPIHTPPTPIAAQAIIAQIEGRGDCDYEFEAMINGVAHVFTAWFVTDWERDSYDGEYLYLSRGAATCALVGAYASDPDDEYTAFAGNRAELAALIGEAEVCRWEMEQSERRTEEG